MESPSQPSERTHPDLTKVSDFWPPFLGLELPVWGSLSEQPQECHKVIPHSGCSLLMRGEVRKALCGRRRGWRPCSN